MDKIGNKIAEKKMANVCTWIIVFLIVDIIVILLGDRPPDKGFIEYAAWMTVGLTNLIVIGWGFLLCIGWAAG